MGFRVRKLCNEALKNMELDYFKEILKEVGTIYQINWFLFSTNFYCVKIYIMFTNYF